MNVYEVVQNGFNGATDKTDNKIIWVAAHCKEHVESYFKDNYMKIHSLPELSIEDFGIDIILNEEGKNNHEN